MTFSDGVAFMFEKTKKEFTVTETNITFESIYHKSYFPVDIPEVKEATVLLIPNEHLNSNIGLTFPENTNDFLVFLQDRADKVFKPDIAVADKDFKKYIMHSAVVQLATIVCTAIVLPIVINLVSAYLYDLLKRDLKTDEELSAEITLYIQKGQGKSLKLHYKGPVSGLKDTLNSVAVSHFGETFELTKSGQVIEVSQRITPDTDTVIPISEVDINDGSSRN